jgi:hypothetical protein
MNIRTVPFLKGGWHLTKAKLPLVAKGVRRARIALKERFYKSVF